MGIHPDWGMIGTLRTELADRGFATLSIQMPVTGGRRQERRLSADLSRGGRAALPEAVGFLKAKGYTQLASCRTAWGHR